MRGTDPILDWHINTRWPAPHAMLGPIPTYVTEACPDPAWMQFRDNAQLGWEPEPSGWLMMADGYLQPGTQRPWEPVAVAALRDEGIYVYAGGWVAVCQRNGDFTVARVFIP